MTIDLVEKIWHFVGMVGLLIVAGVVTVFIFAPKKVDGYYLSYGNNATGQAAVCVYAHWTWHVDEVSFCTDDQQKALDFVAKANASIAK